MTIYDADYLAEQAKTTGVTDTVAEGQEVETFYDEGNSQDNVDHEASASQEAEVSEKEYNFKALRDSIAQEKAERESERLRYQQELENMRYQMQQMQPEKKEVSDPLDGLEKDEWLTVDKFRQAQKWQQKQYEQEIADLKTQNLENQARLRHSDYDEVMEKYSIPFLKNDTNFAHGIRNAPDPAEYAYQIGRMRMDIDKAREPEVRQSRDAQRLVQNSRKPVTLSNVRGGQQAISTAELYETMSDKDFEALVRKNMERLL